MKSPALLLVLLAFPAQAQEVRPTHQYDFSESCADAMGGPPMESGGGYLHRGEYRFEAGCGPRVSHVLASPEHYSIEMVVKLSVVSSYRALINLADTKRSTGYFLQDGSISFYSLSQATRSGTVDIIENQWHRIIFTRDGATAIASAYVDGTLRLSASDPKGKFIAKANEAGILHFCRDNLKDHSAGALDQIRIYDRPLTAAEVAAIPPLPKVIAQAVAHIPARPVREITGQPPIAVAQSVTLDAGERKRITLAGSMADASDAGTFLSFIIVTPPAHGTLAGSGPRQTYTPAAGYSGPDSFTFMAHDGALGSAAAAVSLTVTDVPAPVTPAPALPALVDPHPTPDNGFGRVRVVLDAGNVVITSPMADIGGLTDCGAVYLFNGNTGALISTLSGSAANDFAGSGGVTALTGGNFVVCSPQWDSGDTPDAGAATWGSGSEGISGAVNAANSLVGASPYDFVGNCGVTALANGNYVVSSRNWDLGTVSDVGAATWGNGHTGVTGIVSPANSLTGSSPFDLIGLAGVTALANGNYVVCSSAWDHGEHIDVGAVTWGHGGTGTGGLVSPINSLTGSAAHDLVGGSGVAALTLGHYVVISPSWDHETTAAANVGAVTWVNGNQGIIGTVSAANSLIGTTRNARLGSQGIIPLPDGHYQVQSPRGIITPPPQPK